MSSSPAGCKSSVLAYPQEFDQALTKPDQAWDADNQRDHICATASSIRSGRADQSGSEEHATRHKKISENFCVTRQGVGQQYISKFAAMIFRQTADTDSLESGQKPIPASS